MNQSHEDFLRILSDYQGIIHNYIQNEITTFLLFLLALIAVLITLYSFRIRKKRFKEVRNYLQSLYEQL